MSSFRALGLLPGLFVIACTGAPATQPAPTPSDHPGGQASILQAVPCSPGDRPSPPAGESIVAAIDLGCEAGAVAVAGGAVWVVPHLERLALRIDPTTNAITDRIPLGDRGPGAEIDGSDAMIWASVSSASFDFDRLVRIDPAGRRVVAMLEAAAGMPVIGAGYVWAGTPDTVYRIDPTTNTVAASIQVGFSCWVIVLDDHVFCIGSGKAVSIDPATDEFDLVPGVPAGLPVAADDGLVWGVDDASLWAFDVATHRVVADLKPPVGALSWAPDAIVLDGMLWATASASGGAPDKLVRIDRDALAIDCVIETPTSEFGIAAGLGAIWLPALREPWLLRIEPSC